MWAILDAQRNQLFVARYEWQDARLRRVSEIQIVEAVDWLAQLPEATFVTGSGLRRWESQLPSHLDIAPKTEWVPRAATLAACGREYRQAGQQQTLWQLTPQYFRKSAAEEKAAQRE
jgi:tRNA threonylcarbamoyladenosine biosynthesis protein TsaB